MAAIDHIRRPLIAKIKIGQQRLGLDDDVYRVLLRRETGKDSCTQMGIKELEAVLAAMKQQGFVPARPQKGRRPGARSSAEPMMRKVEALLADNGLHWNYAHGMAKRMFGVDRVHWLADAHLHKLIAALQIYADRRKKGEPHGA